MGIISILLRHKRRKLWIPPIICSCVGLLAEMIDRAISGSMVGTYGLKYVSMAGWSSLLMCPVYTIGILGISVINDVPRVYKLPMIIQCVIGGLWGWFVEFIFGILYLKVFDLKVWDYSTDFLNFHGLVCLESYIVFCLATPFCIWLIDVIGALFYGEPWYYNILDNYKEMLFLKKSDNYGHH